MIVETGRNISRLSPSEEHPHSFFRQGVAFFLAALVFLSPLQWASPAFAWGEFTVKDEMELGKKFSVLVKSQMPLVQDPEIKGYVRDIVMRLKTAIPQQPFDFDVNVIRDNGINAFATPGGYVFVNTGLITSMRHESELAGVIAHELAHVTQRHVASRIEQSQWISILSILGALAGAFLGGDAAPAAMAGSMAASQAAMLNYSRIDENEADQVGMNYLSKAGYPPRGMVGAFEVIGRKQWIMGGKIPTYLSTHPDVNERVKDMSLRVSRLPAAQQGKKDDDSRFLRIQTLVRAKYSDPDVAARAFEEQIKGPNKCLGYLGAGILASRQNKVKEGTAAFDAALSCAPTDPLVMREAGRFHYLMGSKKRGQELIAQAVRLDPKDIMALYYKARMEADAGDLDAAIDHTRQILRTEPEDTELHTMLGTYYGQQRKLFPAYLHLAYASLYSNNPRKTEQNYDKAKGLAQTQAEKDTLTRFENEYKERRQYWK